MAVEIIRKVTKRIFIATNVLIGILLVAGCFGNRLDPAHFWYTGLLSLAAFYLLLALVAFALFWLFVKPLLTIISCGFILLCWKPLNNLVQLRLTSNFKIEKQSRNLRVMSWNVEHFDIIEHKSHPERRDEMIGMIREYAPDVACFQEMVGSDSNKTAINYIPSFIEKLDMGYSYFTFDPKFDFDSKHHFGIITFSRYPIINKQTISYYPNNYNSTFQYVDIVKGEDTFRVFNIHLQSLRFSHENRRYIESPTLKDESDIENSKTVIAKLRLGFLRRKVQSERIRAEMDKSPYPVIICGDFNDVPNSYAYRKISHGMKDCFTAKGAGIGRTFYAISPTLRIDYIFANKEFGIEQYVRIMKKVSDHFPVIADLFYTRRPPE